MLLAEELALIAIDPESGRHGVGDRSPLNACLAALLVAELVLDGVVVPGDRKAALTVSEATVPTSPVLSAVADIVRERGPKVKTVLSHMSRGLTQRLGSGTWDTVVAGLVDVGAVATGRGALLPRNPVLAHAVRDAIVARLRAAAAGDETLDARTAMVLSMTGPANLLELVAPDRSRRKHARRRIDHALDQTQLEPIGETVRRVLAEAAAGVIAGASVVATSAATSG